jgi:hypothetical protein
MLRLCNGMECVLMNYDEFSYLYFPRNLLIYEYLPDKRIWKYK